jgi:predicted nuclease of predicted toxin-antitoxin system
VRFLLDHDVDARVARMLRQLGHECLRAAEIRLDQGDDDDLTVWACDRGAVLVTHDVEFTRRRRKNTVGWHLQLRCLEPQAEDLLKEHLDEVITAVSERSDVTLVLSKVGLRVLPPRWS